ncbi:NADH-quinone oxidoreductase subunit H [Plantactinospora sp. KLBMP9567]|uniref:NADH-quinone oxidoreductase subunit H n=1 Tax=Plantactinospora sp. KLBMP9567 TaxID=3085900 RepID=UPI0029828443|nr:NADH-quinone oxidoreductase subunit H [Plantactinospora sp. KLBMP9567]MDW5327123.1 NADH-quinone oxidoreductase subunit H [Plantactinospora sp. KLBMP9567]
MNSSRNLSGRQVVNPAPLWSVLLAPVALAGFAVAAVTGDAVLAGRATGRRFAVGMAVTPLAEAARLLVAPPRTTVAPDRLLWRLGGAGVAVAAVLAVAVVPLGDRVVVDLDVGVVWFNAMEVVTWAAVWLAGWGPNALFPLVGGYRFVAQGLAYQLPFMLALITAATGAQSLRIADIVAAQRQLWFVVWMPVAFLVYLAGVLAFSFLGPFDYPAARDIAGGVLAETGGVDRLMLLAGRWLLLTAGAAMAVPLFLGGGLGPLLPAWVWSLVKTVAVLAVLVYLRRRLPTIRADRYVELAWVVLIPVAVAQALVPALVVLGRG